MASWPLLTDLALIAYDLIIMASITKKNVRGQTYYYARECKRVNGRPTIVWQKYLGRLEDIISAVETQKEPSLIPKPLPKGMVTDFGAVAALFQIASRLKLVEIIDKHVPKKGRGPSVGNYLLVAALNRAVAPGSKARVGEWFQKTVLRRLLNITSRQLSSQRYWDNMERLSVDQIVSIESELTGHLAKEFKLNLHRVLFDATNFFTFIDTFNDRCTLAQRGKSKQERASLRIVGLALLVSADFHVPLFHHTYPGNQPDAPTFASVAEELFCRCKSLLKEVEHLTLVLDKGNNSEDNFKTIANTGHHFVGSLVPNHHQELLEIPSEKFYSLAADGFPGVLAYRTAKKVFDSERTVLVVYNENLFVTQSKTLLREIARRQQHLRELSSRLDRWREGLTRGGRPPSVEATKKTVLGWLSARHMKELLKADVTEKDGFPLVKSQFDQQAWQNLQETLLGKTILFTDNADWTDAEIVRAYRSQYHVESAFRELKDPHHIALRPQYHWTDNKIRVHVFICILALTLLSLLRRELHSQGIELSVRKMLDLLEDIRELNMVFPPNMNRDEPSIRTSLTQMSPEQLQLYQLLELAQYTSS